MAADVAATIVDGAYCTGLAVTVVVTVVVVVVVVVALFLPGGD